MHHETPLEVRWVEQLGESNISIVKFPPKVPVAVPVGSPKGIAAFTVIDGSVKGIKPGWVLVCRPPKKGDDLKPNTVVIVREKNGELVPRRLRDADGEIVAVAFKIQTPVP